MRISDWSSDVCSSDLRLQKVANWTIGLSLFAVAAIAAHATGVTAKIHEEYAQAVGRAGFQVRHVEFVGADRIDRSVEQTSEIQSLMRISYPDLCLYKKNDTNINISRTTKNILLNMYHSSY